jgi:hypothetical protein
MNGVTEYKIEQAAADLVAMFIEVAPKLRDQLAEVWGTHIQNVGPVVLDCEPYDVELGIEDMRQKVQDAGALFVSGLHCESAVYGERGNHWFRHVHDLGHLIYDLGFDAASENRVHRRLWRYWLRETDTYKALGEARGFNAMALYYCDTVGQTDYFEQHGEFPADQFQFAVERLRGALE